ncbi:MAG TPA: hypothetical protein VJA26_09405, partial [Gammaproteobacteria bacterium]|nr:hypothetical protein [Gammaproteobacteria bacterium]
PLTAAMLGLDEAELRRQLQPQGAAAASAKPSDSRGPNTLSFGGREIQLPEGVDAEQITALMAKRRSGTELSEEERALLRRVMQQAGGMPGGGEGFAGPGGPSGFVPPGGPSGFGEGANAAAVSRAPNVTDYQFGGDYWVVLLRDNQAVPVPVRAGLTDLEYSEIISGLNADDRVLLLPSTSLYEQQERLQQFISERFGSSTPFSQQPQQQQLPRGFR